MNHQDIDDISRKLDALAKEKSLGEVLKDLGIDNVDDIKYVVRQRCLRYIVENGAYEFNPCKTTAIKLSSEDQALLEMMTCAAVDGFVLGVGIKSGIKPDKPDTTYLLN